MPETSDLPELADPTPETVLFEGHPAPIASAWLLLLCILTLGIAWLILFARSRAKHYRITTERIVIEHGLLSKKMDQIDVYRINDYVVELPFGQRLMGTGNLLIKAMDRTTPELRIQALKTDVRQLYESLRTATEQEKKRRGVRMIDYE